MSSVTWEFDGPCRISDCDCDDGTPHDMVPPGYCARCSHSLKAHGHPVVVGENTTHVTCVTCGHDWEHEYGQCPKCEITQLRRDLGVSHLINTLKRPPGKTQRTRAEATAKAAASTQRNHQQRAALDGMSENMKRGAAIHKALEEEALAGAAAGVADLRAAHASNNLCECGTAIMPGLRVCDRCFGLEDQMACHCGNPLPQNEMLCASCLIAKIKRSGERP